MESPQTAPRADDSCCLRWCKAVGECRPVPITCRWFPPSHFGRYVRAFRLRPITLNEGVRLRCADRPDGGLKAMAFFDISAILAALRDRPASFSMVNEALRHDPTGLSCRFVAEACLFFDADGVPRFVDPVQAEALIELYMVWRAEYWDLLPARRGAGRFSRWLPRVLSHLARAWRRPRANGDTALSLYGQVWSGASDARGGDDDRKPPPQPTERSSGPGGAGAWPMRNREALETRRFHSSGLARAVRSPSHP
jgi:hypothetical protein